MSLAPAERYRLTMQSRMHKLIVLRGRRMMKIWWYSAFAAVVAACATGEPPPKDPNVHYYGHDLPAPPIPSVSAACTADDLQALAAGYMHPPLMAIGDSLYNGVSSLRINWWLAEWSVPAQVAIGLGLIPQDAEWQRIIDPEHPRAFWTPQYPGVGHSDEDGQAPNYGFDVERLGLWDIVFKDALAGTANNLLQLSTAKSPSGRLFNDNLAFSGADTIDVLYRTAASMHERLVNPRAQTGQSNDLALIQKTATSSFLTSYGNVSSIARGFYLINAEFVLNPARHPCIEALSPIDQVLLRKPKRLLVSIGSNDGIYRLGLEGVQLFAPVTDDYAGRCTCIADYLADTYLRDIDELIRRLEAEDEIESVYLNSLIPPSRIANLVPASQGQRIPGSKYFTKYTTSFSLGGSREVAGEEVQKADAFAEQVTERVRRRLEAANARVALRRLGRPGPARKFVLIDVGALTAQYDFKHTQLAENRMLIARGTPGKESVYFDMRAIQFDEAPRVYGKVSEGGFVSFDNMHLTPSGYAMLSGAVLDAIRDNEKVSYPQYRPLISARSMFVLKSNAPFNFLRYGTENAEAIRQRLSDVISWAAGPTQSCPIGEPVPQICIDKKLPP
jgi:hypothetical protein